MKRLMLVSAMILCLVPFGALAEETFAPQGDYRVFCADGLYGVQTLDGETVIPAQFVGIQPFEGDLCVVEGATGEKVRLGLWQLSTGEELLPCDYDNIEITSTAVITSTAFSEEVDYSYSNHLFDPGTKKMVLNDPEINAIYPIEDGRFFRVEYEITEGERITRLVAPDGTQLLDMDFGDAYATSGSNGIVSVDGWEELEGWEWEEGTRFYNAADGTWLDGLWLWGYTFEDGFAAVWGNDWKWYIIDETGTVVSPAYEWIANEQNYPSRYGRSLFSVKQQEGWYVIRVSSDAEPEILLGPIQCKYYPDYLGKGFFALPTNEGDLVFSGTDGKSMLLENTSVSESFIHDSALLYRDGKFGFLFEDLSFIEPAYDDCVEFLDDYGFVKINDLWYPIDRNGQVNLSVSYPYVTTAYHDTYYTVYFEEDSLCLFLNADLQPISCW